MTLELLTPDVLRYVNNFTDPLYVVIEEDGEYSDHVYEILVIYNQLEKAIMLMLGTYKARRTYDPATKTWVPLARAYGGCRTHIREFSLNAASVSDDRNKSHQCVFYSLYHGKVVKVRSDHGHYYDDVKFGGGPRYKLKDNRFTNGDSHDDDNNVVGILDPTFTYTCEALEHWTPPGDRFAIKLQIDDMNHRSVLSLIVLR